MSFGFRRALLAVWLMAACSPAWASDGRVEISHSRALAGGVTPADTPGYPVTLGLRGSYVLTSDLQVPAGATGVTTTTSPVSLDLNGFAIRGPASCQPGSCPGGSARGFVGSAAPVIVRNGTIRGFTGDCVAVLTGSRVQGLVLRDCGRDGVNAGAHSLVLENRIERVGRSGIFFFVAGAYRGNEIGEVGLAVAGAPSVEAGAATGGNACEDGGCSRRGLRRYYLTPNGVTGAQATTACAPGFHFASAYELFATSDLEYDASRGATAADTGSGPVVADPDSASGGLVPGQGWARSGGLNSSSLDNCRLWTSSSPSDSGTVLGLQSPGDCCELTSSLGAPWLAERLTCSTPRPAWCIED
jgi:hypothetical protein